MLNYGNSIQRGFQNFVGNCFSGLFELHRSLVQKRATLLAKGSMNRPRRTSKIPVFMWTLVNRILGKQVSPGGSCMATNQTSLFDGVTCTPLTSELGASNTCLFWWVWWFPQACVLLWKGWWWLQTASTIHCVSPIFKVLVHPFSILWGSWTLGVLLRPSKVIGMVMQNLPKRLPLKLTKFELRVTPNRSCGVTSAYRSCGRPQTGCLWRGSCTLDGHVCNWCFGWWCTQENSLIRRWIREICKVCCWLRIIQWGFGILCIGTTLGTWEFTNRVTCPVSVGAAAKAFRLGLDLGEAFSALFDGQVGPDDFPFSFGLTFTLSFHTSEGYECS